MRRHPKRVAFTLVELLVVIGIIAVLISVLLPVLGSARKTADAVKCASNLRQCYLALRLYVEENHGFIIPVRCGGGGLDASGDQPKAVATPLAKPFTLNGFIFGASSEIQGVQTQDAAWWMNFLAPYIARTSKGGSADNTSLTSGAAKNAVFWCSSWQGYQQNLTGADTNRQATGYAMNYMLNASTTVPSLLSPSAICPFQGWCFANLKNTAGDNSPDPATTGKWYKINQVSRPAERAFLGDSYYYFLKAPTMPSPVVASEADLPGQAALAVNATVKPGQCTYDYYRHGAYPRSDGTTFDSKGGKIAYNILYFDGHVTKAVSRQEGIVSLRMRWPK